MLFLRHRRARKIVGWSGSFCFAKDFIWAEKLSIISSSDGKIEYCKSVVLYDKKDSPIGRCFPFRTVFFVANEKIFWVFNFALEGQECLLSQDFILACQSQARYHVAMASGFASQRLYQSNVSSEQNLGAVILRARDPKTECALQ